VRYSVVIARSARRELERLPETIARRILRRLAGLAVEPRPVGVRKLQGAYDLYRIRAGDYRVIYRIVESRTIVDVIAVRHRRDAYR
jgi:mRNA interferase RelE/StbE